MTDQPAKTTHYVRSRTLSMRVRPFLKWAGGKRQIIPTLFSYVPEYFNAYFEPFLGGGALLFALQPQKAVVNDINPEIINCYVTVRDHPDALITALRAYRNDEEVFYATRNLDRDPAVYAHVSSIERAARIIFLNKTCYNGLFRVNKKGQFNVPFGFYTNPTIVDEPVLRAVSEYLNTTDVTFLCGDFTIAVAAAQQDDFVYLDPPYDPISQTASFTSYTKEQFGQKQQFHLRALVDDLHRRRVQFLLSNHPTDFIDKLYQDYSSTQIEAVRAINSAGNKRGKVKELLVWNYPQMDSK